MRKIAMFLLSFGAVLSFTTVLAPSPVKADDECGSNNFLVVFKPWDAGLEHRLGDNGACHAIIPQGSSNNIPAFVWTIVLTILYDISVAAGIIAVVMVIINGFQYMTSGGSADKVSNAKKGLMQSVIGLAITILAATIINFIVGLF